VIVSHVIVLFDFIEEMHEKGEPFEQAVCDEGIQRLRPVMITVAATLSGAVSFGDSRRPAVATLMLRANRRSGRGHVHHFVVSAGVL
jgi:hypothetical protein